MKPEEITALARKCANEDPNIADLKAPYIRAYEKSYENMLRFLLRRFCLVEKSKVEEEYHEAEVFCNHIDPCGDSWDSWYAQKSVLERLFPDLRKEVES